MSRVRARVREDQVTIPTYPLHPDDVNPRFFELKGTLIYPYTMQDHPSRTPVDRTYRALVLESDHFVVTCIPELGGRIQSVYDKLRDREMFYRNTVIKPGLIALRGAWISGGIEWNRGPQSHTVTSFSPVDVVAVEHPDGSASLVIGYTEMNFRTAWEVRFTLHPGRAFLDERIVLFNPTDAPHSYYFWNNTAFPCTAQTRFCYPMKAASDHDRYFPWPIDDGRDLRWLRNYPDATPVFAYECVFDFFGVYDVGDDYGLVQYADRRSVPGKKAWTWGNADAGRMSQTALADDAGPYIEVQSGPLRTQTDYGLLSPGGELAWREWWYPVAGLGSGFEYATRDVAVERVDRVADGLTEFRIAATATFPGARVELGRGAESLLVRQVDLSPATVATMRVALEDEQSVDVRITAADGATLAEYRSPLEIPAVEIPLALHRDLPEAKTRNPDEMHALGLEHERLMDRARAREWHGRALEASPSHVGALVALARLDAQAGLYEAAAVRLTAALASTPEDGRAWHALGIVRLRQERLDDALACGTEAVARRDTEALGLGLVGRVKMRQGEFEEAAAAFGTAHEAAGTDRVRVFEWLLVAAECAGDDIRARRLAEEAIGNGTTRLMPRAVLAMADGGAWDTFAEVARSIAGEWEFAGLELGLTLAEVGRHREAADMLQAMLGGGAAGDGEEIARPLPLYHLAYHRSRAGDAARADEWLRRASVLRADYLFPSQVEAIPVFEFAIARQPDDAQARLCLGNLLGGLGRLDDACAHWEVAAKREPSLSVALRNLGMDAWKRKSALGDAARWFRAAIEARPSDQVAHRDLARVLVAAGHREEAIDLLAAMSSELPRRGDVTTVLARAYLDEQRYDDAVNLLNASTYSNWEGDIDNWLIFVGAHIERGRTRLEEGDPAAALEDFDAALTYPQNLHVGRSSTPREARTLYWRGRALAALGRRDEARDAWQAGARGAPLDDEQKEFITKCREQLGLPKC